MLIDIEGMECFAYKGYKKYLENNDIPIIMEILPFYFQNHKFNPCHLMLNELEGRYEYLTVDKEYPIYAMYSRSLIYQHGINNWYDVLFLPVNYNPIKKAEFMSLSVIISPLAEFPPFFASKEKGVLVRVPALTKELFNYVQSKRKAISNNGIKVIVIAEDSKICEKTKNKNACEIMNSYLRLSLDELKTTLDARKEDI